MICLFDETFTSAVLLADAERGLLRAPFLPFFDLFIFLGIASITDISLGW